MIRLVVVCDLCRPKPFRSDTIMIHSHPICFNHFGIAMAKCIRRYLPKRKMYNFNRADWPSIKLKSELDIVNWASMMDSIEPAISWMNFKIIRNNIINKFVPLVNIKTEFKSPWFDSECYRKCKEKEKLHKKFKNSKSLDNEIKFKVCRKDF